MLSTGPRGVGFPITRIATTGTLAADNVQRLSTFLTLIPKIRLAVIIIEILGPFARVISINAVLNSAGARAAVGQVTSPR